MPMRVDLDGDRRQALGEANPFLERLVDLLVIEGVRGAVDQAPAIGDGHAAPRLQQLEHARCAILACGVDAFRANRASMRQKLGRDFALFVRPIAFDGRCTLLRAKRFVAREELLDLYRIVGKRLGRRVDRGQASADHDDREADLHIGDGILARGARKLQRHQEVGRGANAVGQAVRQVEDGRPARTRRQRDVIEAHRERAFHVDRPAEAHPAEHREALPSLDDQTQDLEKILVPAHRNSILRYAPEPGHHALIERLVQTCDIADRLERNTRAHSSDARDRRRQRLDLQAVDTDDGVAVVEQMMRERDAGGSHAHDQHALAGVGKRKRPAQIERIPARHQAVDLEPPRKRQHVLQQPRLGLRNVDRLLLLIDARLHAVVADAMAGGRDHGIVDADHGQRAERPPFRAQLVKFGDLLVERASCERHAER